MSRLNQLRWGSAQAGVSLSLASTAWLLSGLSASPLINTLLPALTTLPALLPLRRRAGAFCWILLSSVGLMLLCSPLGAGIQAAWAIPVVLCAGLVIALGQDFSQLPLQRQLLEDSKLQFQQLRRAASLVHSSGSASPASYAPAGISSCQQRCCCCLCFRRHCNDRAALFKDWACRSSTVPPPGRDLSSGHCSVFFPFGSGASLRATASTSAWC